MFTGWFLYISIDPNKVWICKRSQVGFCTYILILMDVFTDILPDVYTAFKDNTNVN